MDSSDAGPLRSFNFGGAHAAGVLAMTALADSYKTSDGRRMQNPGLGRTGLVCAFQNGIRRSWSDATEDHSAVSLFVIRVSSFVADSRPKL